MPQASGSRPRARLITTAWGDRYVAELFDVTLAAALAPGNLPAVVELLDCDVVILTEEARFEQLREHPVFRGLARLCPVELRPVDEFVTRADAYGMALTYALFRGFEDLGEDMVNVHMLFINSDFVLADGSFRTVARKILDGERLILAPSYCVVGEVVGPELERWRDSETSAITARPRELAALGIPNRHNTIRGKTLNQQLFSMEWIDQFYWLVDQETMLVRQLPIAVVSMRPERVLTEMVTFWDYGIIAWACPNTPRCVIADSDDFLMIELRGADTARDQIRLGRPSKEQIARKLYRFITADPLELSRHTLIWHSADLPGNLAEAEAELDRYVSSVVSYLPTPVDYYNHYIWAYHYPTFQKLRGAYLARQGRPLSWDVDALVEYPPHPPTEVFDAAFVAASNGKAKHTAALLSLEQEVPGALAAPVRAPVSECGTPTLDPVRDALEHREQGRVLVLNSRSLPVRLFGALEGSSVEFDGLPTWMDAYLLEGPAEAPAPARPSRFSVEDSCDLCLCEIATPDLLHVRELLETLSFLMCPGSRVYLFYVNPEAGPLVFPAELIASDALTVEFPARVSFVGIHPGSPDSVLDGAERAASRRAMQDFIRAAPGAGAAESQLAAFDEPPDRCLGMIVEIDVTLRQAGPFRVIRRKVPPRVQARPPLDLRPRLLAASKRVANDLGSKLVSLSAERDTLAAALASRQAEIDRLTAKLASAREEKHGIVADRTRLLWEHQQSMHRTATERATLRGYLQRSNMELAAARAAPTAQMEALEKQNRELAEAETERGRLAEREAELAAAQAGFAGRVAELEARNRELTEAASEHAGQLRDRDAELAAAQAGFAGRVAELEARNRELTEAASEHAGQLRDRDAELATAQAGFAGRVAELEARNRELTEAASEHAGQLRDRDAEFAAAQAGFAGRVAELEARNRELTEAASEHAGQLRDRDAEFAAAQAGFAGRVAELEARNRELTEAETERARQLRDRDAELAAAQVGFAGRVAELEARNRELTEAASEHSRQLDERHAELATVRATLSGRVQELEAQNRGLTEAQSLQLQDREAELSAVRAAFGSRVNELEYYNRELIEAGTQRAQQIQEREAELATLRAALSSRIKELEERSRASTEAAADRGRRLEEREAELLSVRAAFGGRIKELEDHNHELTGAATDRARQLQESEAELLSVRAAFGGRIKELEDHNRELTEAATNRARQLQESEAELSSVRAAFGSRVKELEDHNRELTEAATDRARQLQESEAELSSVRAVFGGRVKELEDLNREVTGTATQRSLEMQEREMKFGTLRAALSARVTELEEQNRALSEAHAQKLQEREAELSAVRAAFGSRIKELEDHNQVLTEAATDRARQLQERAETDYQILMAQQQLLAGMKDADPPFLDIYERCREFTMTSVERLYALYKSVEYIVSAGIEGDFVETGVWRGGSCMLMAETLVALGDTSRRILLFDTFEGHPKPDADKDVDVWGNRAIEEWDRHAASGEPWASVSLDEVRANMAQTGYPTDRVILVKGMVENTVPQFRVGPLAMMRLDTDWYRSACVTLEHFFPRLVEGGVLILDDYGHYKGQRSALDEYLETSGEHLLLNRVDYSCRVAVKGPARRFDIRQTRQSAD